MSRLVSAMTSIFGNVTPAPPPALKTPSPMQGSGNPAGTNPGDLPPEGNSSAPAAPPAPLAKFEKFWDTPVVDPNAAKPPASFLANVTPENVAAAAKKVDFRQSVTPQQIEAVSKGGTAGVQALLEVINQVGQDVYTRAALATTAIVSESAKEVRAGVDRDLPSSIRKTQIRGSANEQNENFKNPAVAPMIRALETQAALQHPNASPAEIGEMVKDYMQAFAQTLTTPASEKTPPKNRGEDVDWDAFGAS